MTRRTTGFSLIEMAFVLIIVTLLLGGLLVPFATQVEQKRIAETQKAMEEIKEALIGYAASHGAAGTPHLPCPDTAVAVAGFTPDDGQEDVYPPGTAQDGTCAASEGNLPWADLGVGAQDAWGNRFHYGVTRAFADRVPAPNPGVALNDIGDMQICDRSPTAGPCNPVANTIPAVIISFGKNGRGALNINGTRYPAPTSVDEAENAGTIGVATNFVSRIPTAASAPCDGAGQPRCEFDDLVVWLSPNVLFNRMVAAGRLP